MFITFLTLITTDHTNSTDNPLFRHAVTTTVEALLLSWNNLLHSLLPWDRVLCSQPWCHKCYQFTTTFKIVTATIWLHHWKGMLIARRRISLIYLDKFDTDYNQCSCCGYEIIRHANFIAYWVSFVGYWRFRSSGFLRRVDW